MCPELLLDYSHTLQCAWFTMICFLKGIAMQGSRLTACIASATSLPSYYLRVCVCALRPIWKQSSGSYILFSLLLTVHTGDLQSLRNVMMNAMHMSFTIH